MGNSRGLNGELNPFWMGTNIFDCPLLHGTNNVVHHAIPFYFCILYFHKVGVPHFSHSCSNQTLI
uniref:Uncharacterized protein n=1 Tax=Physcomitrium patens TaxID=3218 RepID=A0A2K1JQN0_PHYPA|nr:hypothetical protein PHYPA_016223 [Physcomitrium patens]